MIDEEIALDRIKRMVMSMNRSQAVEEYKKALQQGRKTYQFYKSIGRSGHLPSLDGLLKSSPIVSTVNLGIRELPLAKIVGTYSHSRRIAFARNFMPLDQGNSEFGDKWTTLCEAHLEEGIRDPIKVYEYLNYYYVVEGNKRVSVLKYFDAYAIDAEITRLIPRYDENDPLIRTYYEFLEFSAKTGIYEIWFSKEQRFARLYRYLQEYNPPHVRDEEKYSHFIRNIYRPFRRVYLECGGDQLSNTTGDAFIMYAKFNTIPVTLDEQELAKTMPSLLKELDSYEKDEIIAIQTGTEVTEQTDIVSTITTLLKSNRTLKIGFVYARTIEGSGWTYSHELGRQHIEDVFEDQIETTYMTEVPETADAYYSIKELADQGYDVIFTTSEIFMKPTLRCAMEYPDIKFFNCSEQRPYVHLTNYFGRTYEPRFLSGLIAGAMTQSNIIGYTATSPTSEVISSINAFALGAKMVNPYAQIKVAWTRAWNSPIQSLDVAERLVETGADLVTNKNLLVPRKETWNYGVYSMLCSIDPETHKPSQYLASPIWKWGMFYERIIRSILNGSYKRITQMYESNKKLMNFWWGMASGGIDIYYNKKHVPKETQKLLELMKKMIITGDYHPFTGPVYDTDGQLRIETDEVISTEDILSMDWYVDNVEVEAYFDE